MNTSIRVPISMDVLNDILIIQSKLGWKECVLEVGKLDYEELKAITYHGAKEGEFAVEQRLKQSNVTLICGVKKLGIDLRPI